MIDISGQKDCLPQATSFMQFRLKFEFVMVKNGKSREILLIIFDILQL